MSILGFVTVEDYGWKGDGTSDDTAAVQAAVNTGKNVFIPKGSTKLTSPITLSTEGQSIVGENSQNTLIVSASGTSHDFFRIAAAFITIENMMYRPGAAANYFARVYAPFFHMRWCRALAAVDGSGKVLKFTDTNPSGGFVPGAYTHLIENNRFGYDAYAFAQIIEVDTPTGGLQACKFLNNVAWTNKFLAMTYGGGNTYHGNLFQSDTGTSGTPTGDCLDLGSTVHGDIIHGNYFERYDFPVKAINNDWFGQAMNHYDQCNNIPSGGGTVNYNLLTGGTNIGTMTGNGGLAAAFDGDTSKIWDNCAREPASGNTGYIGKDWGGNKTVTQYKIFGSTDFGLDSTESPNNITVKLQGSTDNFSSSIVQLHTDTFSDANGISKTYNSGITTTTAYLYHRVEISMPAGGPAVCAQVEFYETV